MRATVIVLNVQGFDLGHCHGVNLHRGNSLGHKCVVLFWRKIKQRLNFYSFDVFFAPSIWSHLDKHKQSINSFPIWFWKNSKLTFIENNRDCEVCIRGCSSKTGVRSPLCSVLCSVRFHLAFDWVVFSFDLSFVTSSFIFLFSSLRSLISFSFFAIAFESFPSSFFCGLLLFGLLLFSNLLLLFNILLLLFSILLLLFSVLLFGLLVVEGGVFSFPSPAPFWRGISMVFQW